MRSVALSKTELNADQIATDIPSEWLNETLFTNYHRFVGTTRVLTTVPAPPQ